MNRFLMSNSLVFRILVCSRRRFPRSIEQAEREIQRLQSSLDALRSQRGEDNVSDIGGRESNDELLATPPNSDIKMRDIIGK